MQQVSFSASNKSSTNVSNAPIIFSVKAGDIKLRLNTPRNIFYADDVVALEILPDYEKLIGIKRPDFEDGSFATRGKVITPLAVAIDTKDTIIGGAYKDTMTIKNMLPYQVKIYITYEIDL